MCAIPRTLNYHVISVHPMSLNVYYQLWFMNIYWTDDRDDFKCALLQRLGTPHMKLKPEQRASISAVYNRQERFVCIWLLTRFIGSVCYEVLPFVMDCKLARVDRESGQHNTSCSVVLVVSPLISLVVDHPCCSPVMVNRIASSLSKIHINGTLPIFVHSAKKCTYSVNICQRHWWAGILMSFTLPLLANYAHA